MCPDHKLFGEDNEGIDQVSVKENFKLFLIHHVAK